MTNLHQEMLCFGDFRLDPDNACLWRGMERCRLTPKAFSVLLQLIKASGRLVSKEELLDTVWPGVVVTDASLKVCIREARKTLGDNGREPEFIETVHKRGYRFIAPLKPGPPRPKQEPSLQETRPQPTRPNAAPIGRAVVLSRMEQCLERVSGGQRHLLFITGDPGIGKTTVIDAFSAWFKTHHDCWIGLGQSVEHKGPCEVYLPLLDALGRLCRGPDGDTIIKILHRYAPNWLIQLPALISAEESVQLQRQLGASSPQRMLRELAEALERVTLEKPLLLILEDLHWCDTPTVDALAFLARRREPCKLLVLASYRPVEIILNQHPLKALKQALLAQGFCSEIPLELLSSEATLRFVENRFQGCQNPRRLARVIHQQTDGNPLFMVNLAQHLITRGVILQTGNGWTINGSLHEIDVPESLRGIIQQQFEQYNPEEQALLEIMSTAGMQFSAVEIGAVAATPRIEQALEDLERRSHFLRSTGLMEYPDGTLTSGYEFCHALYRRVLYQSISPLRRLQLHLQIGRFLESCYGSASDEQAANLANHFLQGRDYPRAIVHLRHAAEIAVHRYAFGEAIQLIRKCLDLVAKIPANPERSKTELMLLTRIGPLLISSQGNANPEVQTVYSRARDLCLDLGDEQTLFPVVFGLRSYHLTGGQLEQAHALALELMELANRTGKSEFVLEAHAAQASTCYFLGRLSASRDHARAGLALYDRARHHHHAGVYGLDPGVFCSARYAQVLALMGHPGQSLQQIQHALSLGRELDPYSLIFAIHNASQIHLYQRDGAPALKHAEEGLILAEKYDFTFLIAWGRFLKGWALAMTGAREPALVEIDRALSSPMPDSLTTRSYLFTFLAEAYWHLQLEQKGLELLETVAELDCEYTYAGERAWLQGAFLERLGTAQDESAKHYLNAIHINRRLGARLYELRATTALCRLLQQRGEIDKARDTMQAIFNQFNDSHDLSDWQEAGSLLEQLTAPESGASEAQSHRIRRPGT